VASWACTRGGAPPAKAGKAESGLVGLRPVEGGGGLMQELTFSGHDKGKAVFVGGRDYFVVAE
jgi:hypothetical protein